MERQSEELVWWQNEIRIAAMEKQINAISQQGSYLTKVFLNLELRLFDLERRCEREHLQSGRDD